jgi:hypothetical protein
MKPSAPPRGIQTLVHFIEEGAGQVWLRRLLAVTFLGLCGVLYQVNEATNFRAPDAMDAAQLARNLAEGRGYTTGFIRPLSLHLLQDHATARGLEAKAVREMLSRPQPDLENAPAYPVLLAALMKVIPARYRYGLPADQFYRRPYVEVAISVLNLALFGVVILLAGWLGRRLFDPTVGGLAAVLTLGTEHFWRLANSGLPSLLVMILLLGLVHVWVSWDRAGTAETTGGGRRFLLAAAAGVLVGATFLTRYSYGWLVLPVVGFVLWQGGARRGRLALVVLAAFALVAAPWVARNWRLSGTPFGTAGYALFSGTETFSGDRLERSQHPRLDQMDRVEPARKLSRNLGPIVSEEIPRLGGSWLTVFFLAGLLVPFRDPTRNRARWLIVAMLAVLTVVILLDQIEWPATFLRTLAFGAVVLVLSGPFLIAILPPRTPALADPPYRPQLIREFADFTPAGTLFMSDIPWAVAWYGPRECVWATLRVVDTPEANVANRREDFFVFSEARRPVQAVYLSPYWADQPMRSRFFGDADFAWGRFYLDVLVRQTIPTGFPLKNVLGGPYMVSGHFLLADRDYWNHPGH